MADKKDPRKTRAEAPRARRTMTENGVYVVYAPSPKRGGRHG